MIDLNDPRLTSFALGELDAAEREEIESAVQASPELQREVTAIQQSASTLAASLSSESCPSLTAAQRAAIEAASGSAATAQLPPKLDHQPHSWRRFLVVAVAASLLLVAFGGTAFMWLDQVGLPPRSVALQEQIEPAEEATPTGAADDQFRSGVAAGGPSADDPLADPNHQFGFGNDRYRVPLEGAGRDELGTVTQQRRQELTNERASRRDTEGEGKAERGAGGRWRFQPGDDDRGGFERSDPLGESAVSGGESNVRRPLGATDLDREEKAAQEAAGELPGASPLRQLFSENTPAPTNTLTNDSSESRRNDPLMLRPETRPGSGLSDGEERSDLPMLLKRRAAPAPAGPAPAGPAPAGPAPADPAPAAPAPADPAPADPADPAADSPANVAEVDNLEDLTIASDVKSPARVSGEAKLKKSARPAVNSTWVRSRATPNASQLMIGDHDGLPLEGMQVNVLVDGFRARVLLDLYFYNNRGGRFEGNFKLRLPNGASLYYFAFGQSAYEYRPMVDHLASKGFLTGDLIRAASLDPHGILKSREGSWTDVKEARVVPREKAAHAYGETVRRRVDPALVEWSGAGVFNARVFPLMPNKLHRVVVGYDVDLQQQGEDLVYALNLPADSGECVVDLNVSALPGVTAEVTPAARPFMSGGRAYYNFKDPEDQAINVRLKSAGSMLLTGTDAQAGDFFVSRLTPDLPADESNASSPRAMFLVDTSLSSRPAKFNVWLDMLEAVLTENRDSIDEFAVLFFNIESNWWHDGFRKNNAKNVDRLLADCRKLSLEGATDLRQALREAAEPGWARESAAANAPRPDLFLLSDGAVTWGEMNVHRLSQLLQQAETGPLFAYQTGMTGTAVGMLEHLTRETGGAVFSVVNESEIPRAARAHRQRPWQLTEVALAGGTDVLVAGRPKFIYPGQSLLVVGRGQPDAEATVRVRRGDQQKLVEVALDRKLESALAPRVYGQVAVGQLEDLGTKVDDVSIAYARHFRVTGRTCSLLMLESEADYQRFNIKPEEDAFLVRTSPSADLIATKLDELTEQLGDAKVAVTDWLSKLERTPGLQFKMPTALRLVVDRLPREAFEVEPKQLTCSRTPGDDTPKNFQRQLDSGRLDYEILTKQSNIRFEQLGAADALRTLSSLIENNPGDPVLTRDVAFSALEWGFGGQAFQLLQRVSALRPYEPQTYQAMCRCLSETGNADLAMIYYEVALNAKWHDRYRDVKQIVGVEYLDLLRRIERGEITSHAGDYAAARLETIRDRAPVKKADLVVTMIWNTDRTDVDLHVIEPSGEECYYEHPRTRMGGRMTRDVTEGLGPEMYTLVKAQAGDYRVLANYFGSDANRSGVRSKVYVTIYRNFGDPKRQWIEKKTITLAKQKEKRELLTVTVKR